MSDNAHLKRLVLIGPFIRRLLVGLVIMVITVVIQLLYPKAISHFIDTLNIQRTTAWYAAFAGIMLAVLSIHAIATALRYYIFESTGLMVVASIRNKLHKTLLQQQVAFYDKHNIGELTNRLSADVEVLQDTLTMGLSISIRSLCVCIGGIVMLLLTSPLLSIMLLIFLPVSLFLGKWIGKNMRVKSKTIQECQAGAGKVAHENFSNIKLVHAFNRHNKAQLTYEQSTDKALGASVNRARFLALFRGGSSFLAFFVLLVTLWLGANQILQGTLTIGELTSFVIYAMMVATSASAVTDFWSDWMRTIGATDRIFEIIDSIRITEQDTKATYNSKQIQGNVAFQNVTFSYPERPQEEALKNFSLTVSKGEKVALIGSSGAGKSTVASIILGFYQVQKGKILFDGISAEQLPIEYIRNSIAIVEQDPSLFSGSILDNIAYGSTTNDVEFRDVCHASKLAYAHDFIESFPSGYDTIVGERGVQLSGGQKQRITIARALLRNPKILILDEATSALDSASELKVQHALDNLMEGRTTIMIAHRYSTIAKADRIVVLDNGRMVQEGTHYELQKQRNGIYWHLMGGQLSTRNLA